MLTSVSVDVYCQKTHEGSLIYRLYVDNDLLTERTWIWPAYETYLNESMEIDVDPGKHQIKLINFDKNITFKNVCVNKQLVSKGDRLQEFEFTV
jgi:hypothetical protein